MSRTVVCPKHDTGAGPCYCGLTPAPLPERWVPDRARWFYIERTEGGQGLDITFYRQQDLPADKVGKVRPVEELPGLLSQVDAVQTPAERVVVEVRAKLELLIKHIDERV
jgi:hypothetical protein